MARAICPTCEQLVEITPTGEVVEAGKSSQWWLVANHDLAFIDDDPLSYRSRIVRERCEGSGKRV